MTEARPVNSMRKRPRFGPRRPLRDVILVGLLFSAAWCGVLWPAPDPRSAGLPTMVRVTDRSGRTLHEYRPEGRAAEVNLGSVSNHVLGALIATEDRRFAWHPGFDLWAVGRAAWSNLRAGSIESGASTLAMQVARMRRGGRSTWWSKLSDARMAVRLTLWHGRSAVLEEWLGRTWFGRGAFGIEAAALAWFDKPASALNLGESAFLVGLPQSPAVRTRDPLGSDALDRQRHVLAAMAREGLITTAEAETAARLPLDFAETEPVPLHAVHLSVAEARRAADRDAVEVRTTIDLALQTAVEDFARGHLANFSDRGIGQVAAIVLDNQTGDVLAWLGSADFEDVARQGANDGVLMRRQPGSALKPFAYAEAVASHIITPSTILADVETSIMDAGAAFSPENYDRRYHGPVSARRALASSYNVPAIRLALRLSPQRVLDRLHAFGFGSLDRPASYYGVGIVLGNGEVQLIELARAYAGLARGGSLTAVRPVSWIRTAALDTMRVVYPGPVATGIDAATSYLITDILRDPEARAPGFGRGGPLELPFPAATKTGTSKDYRDNWAVGYTPAVTVAVWAGNFDGSPMRDVSGVTGAGTLMRAILEWIGPAGEFEVPAGIVGAEVCPQSGLRRGAYCPGTASALFLVTGVPTDTCDVHRQFAIDTSTGFLADSLSRDEDIVRRTYTVYPSEFRTWVRANSLALPPPARPRASSPGEIRVHPDLRILVPDDGIALQIDPVLRADYQRLHLRAAAPTGLYDLHWLVDDERLDAPFDSASWRLVPGRHRIEARGTAPDGSRVRSHAVTIRVHDSAQ